MTLSVLAMLFSLTVSARETTHILRNTNYYVAMEKDYAGLPLDDEFLAMDDSVIARVNAAFRRATDIEGTGKLVDGRVLNFHGRKDGRVRYHVTNYPYGHGIGDCPLEPFRSVAVDPAVIIQGSTIRIDETIGMRLPDGTIHDGIWRAEDGGSAIKNDRIDLFIGERGNFRTLERAGIKNLSPLTVTVIAPKPDDSCIDKDPR